MANRQKLKGKALIGEGEPLAFTIQSEWFPGNEPEGKDYDPGKDPWRKGDESALETELRLFGAATRLAFNRLLAGDSRETLKTTLQGLFGLNSRYSDDAILKAREMISSQAALIPLEIEETKAKLGKTGRKLNANRK